LFLWTATSWVLIHHLYVVLIETPDVMTRAKTGSALSRVGARKGIRSMKISNTVI